MKYGGDKGAPWCASFVSWLYGEGQGIEYNNTAFEYVISKKAKQSRLITNSI